MLAKVDSIISKEVEMHNARRMKEFSIDNILTEVMISVFYLNSLKSIWE